MNVDEFRDHGKEMIDLICGYFQTIGSRRVFPTVTPGYLQMRLPDTAPEVGEQWALVEEDIEKHIMPGITHWQHPRFHAFFPSGNCFPSILGDMLSDAIGCIGFSWAASPACSELEMMMLDWLAKMMKLPSEFMHCSNLGGGGVIQGSASDSMLVTMIGARHRTIGQVLHTFGRPRNHLREYNFPKIRNLEFNKQQEINILSKLVCYTSKLTHSAVNKNAQICFVKIRYLNVDEKYSMRGYELEKAVQEDLSNGLIPFYVSATLGTTSCCSFDNLMEIGPICRKYDLWLHIDAAYAGSSFICPEFRHYLDGIEYADSFDFNPNKFMLINFDCSVLWLRNSSAVTSSMAVNPLFLKHKHEGKTNDFRNWSIPLSRRFRSLKIWFTIRSYGVKGLQEYIRRHVTLAKLFETNVRSCKRYFEIVGEVVLGLVCFRIKSLEDNFPEEVLNKLNAILLKSINESGLLHLTPAYVNLAYVLRFCVCKEHATPDDIEYAWKVIFCFSMTLLITYKKFYEAPEEYIKMKSPQSERGAPVNKIRRLVYSNKSKRECNPSEIFGVKDSFNLNEFLINEFVHDYLHGNVDESVDH